MAKAPKCLWRGARRRDVMAERNIGGAEVGELECSRVFVLLRVSVFVRSAGWRAVSGGSLEREQGKGAGEDGRESLRELLEGLEGREDRRRADDVAVMEGPRETLQWKRHGRQKEVRFCPVWLVRLGANPSEEAQV